MSSLLYIVKRSPFMYSDLERASELAFLQKEAGNDVGIVLMQDSVLITTKKSDKSKMLKEMMINGINVYAIEADFKARGLSDVVLDGVKKVSYEDFIDLVMENYEKTVSF